MWGVIALKVPEPRSVLNMFTQAARAAKKLGCAQKGDLVVVTAGIPIGKAGTTNMLKVEKI